MPRANGRSFLPKDVDYALQGWAMTVIDGLRVIPANEASWEDLQTVFGTRGIAPICQCQRYKLARGEAFSKFPAEERAFRLREQSNFDVAAAETTTGLIAYLDGEPVGWCAV